MSYQPEYNNNNNSNNNANKNNNIMMVVIGGLIFVIGILVATYLNKSNTQPQYMQPQMLQNGQQYAQPAPVQAQLQQPQANQQVPQQQVVMPATMNSVTKILAEKGLKVCAQKVEQVTNYLGAGGTIGAVLFTPAANIDQNVVSISLEIIGADKKSAYATVSFSPNAANGCSVAYDATAFWPKKCDEVTAENYKGKKLGKAVQKNIHTLDLSANSKVFLMPVGQASCLSIKKEVLF